MFSRKQDRLSVATVHNKSHVNFLCKQDMACFGGPSLPTIQHVKWITGFWLTNYNLYFSHFHTIFSQNFCLFWLRLWKTFFSMFYIDHHYFMLVLLCIFNESYFGCTYYTKWHNVFLLCITEWESMWTKQHCWQANVNHRMNFFGVQFRVCLSLAPSSH